MRRQIRIVPCTPGNYGPRRGNAGQRPNRPCRDLSLHEGVLPGLPCTTPRSGTRIAAYTRRGRALGRSRLGRRANRRGSEPSLEYTRTSVRCCCGEMSELRKLRCGWSTGPETQAQLRRPLGARGGSLRGKAAGTRVQRRLCVRALLKRRAIEVELSRAPLEHRRAG
jgi:hypothetical protein